MPTLEREDFYRSVDELKAMIEGTHARLDIINGRVRTSELKIISLEVKQNIIITVGATMMGFIGWLVKRIIFGV